MDQMTIAAALDGPWDKLGAAIVAAGHEDSSGARRYYAACLWRRDFSPLTAAGIANPEALRQSFVDAFGEDG